MPSLSDLEIRLPVGTTSLDITGPLVDRDTANSRQTRYSYSWVDPGTTTPATTPLFGTMNPAAAPNLGNRLTGNWPTSARFKMLDCLATPAGSQPPRHTPDDAGQTYRARVTFVASQTQQATVAEVGTMTTGFNNLEFRDSDRFYQGLVYDNPYAMYLFMGLPSDAPATAGPLINFGDTPQRWLPIENVQQFNAPAVTSMNLPLEIREGPNIGGSAPTTPGVVPTVARGNYRTNIQYGAASVRVLWNEEYASHGGPYGLYEASINMGLAVPWVYYQRNFEHPERGKIIRLWHGYVGEFRDRLTRQGRIVDAVIYPEDAPHFGDNSVTPGLTSVRSIVWPQAAPGRQ